MVVDDGEGEFRARALERADEVDDEPVDEGLEPGSFPLGVEPCGQLTGADGPGEVMHERSVELVPDAFALGRERGVDPGAGDEREPDERLVASRSIER